MTFRWIYVTVGVIAASIALGVVAVNTAVEEAKVRKQTSSTVPSPPVISSTVEKESPLHLALSIVGGKETYSKDESFLFGIQFVNTSDKTLNATISETPYVFVYRNGILVHQSPFEEFGYLASVGMPEIGQLEPNEGGSWTAYWHLEDMSAENVRRGVYTAKAEFLLEPLDQDSRDLAGRVSSKEITFSITLPPSIIFRPDASSFLSAQLWAKRTDGSDGSKYLTVDAWLTAQNPKLGEVLDGADANYEIISHSSSNSYAESFRNPWYSVSVTEPEAYGLINAFRGYIEGDHIYPAGERDDYYLADIKFEGRYYLIRIFMVY